MAATNAASVISELKELTWQLGDKGPLPLVPCRAAPYSIKHRLAEHTFPYIDGAAHDWTGRAPIEFTATLMFLNTVKDKMYPHAWEIWREALLANAGDIRSGAGGNIGKLNHPDIGEILARVSSVDVDLDAGTRSGITVKVTWVESIPKMPPDILSPAKQSFSVIDVAGRIDAKMAARGFGYPTGMSHQTVAGMAKAVMGTINMVEVAATGVVNNVLGKAVALESIINGDAFSRYKSLDNFRRSISSIMANVDALETGDHAATKRRDINIQQMNESRYFHKMSVEEAKLALDRSQVEARAGNQDLVDDLEQVLDTLDMQLSSIKHQQANISGGAKSTDQMKKSKSDHELLSSVSTTIAKGSAKNQMSASMAQHFATLGIGSIVLPVPSTLELVGEQFHNTIGDMLSLNSELMGVPTLEPGTTVYYYLGKS